jgi:hypothetical protein
MGHGIHFSRRGRDGVKGLDGDPYFSKLQVSLNKSIINVGRIEINFY